MTCTGLNSTDTEASYCRRSLTFGTLTGDEFLLEEDLGDDLNFRKSANQIQLEAVRL